MRNDGNGNRRKLGVDYCFLKRGSDIAYIPRIQLSISSIT